MMHMAPREGTVAVVSGSHDWISESGGYVVDSIEYVSETPLPPNEVFDDPVALAKYMNYALNTLTTGTGA